MLSSENVVQFVAKLFTNKICLWEIPRNLEKEYLECGLHHGFDSVCGKKKQISHTVVTDGEMWVAYTPESKLKVLSGTVKAEQF